MKDIEDINVSVKVEVENGETLEQLCEIQKTATKLADLIAALKLNEAVTTQVSL